MFPKLFTIPAFDVLGRNFGPFSLHTYGVLLVSALLAALWLAIRRMARQALSVRLAAQAEEAVPSEKSRRNSRRIAITSASISTAVKRVRGKWWRQNFAMEPPPSPIMSAARGCG